MELKSLRRNDKPSLHIIPFNAGDVPGVVHAMLNGMASPDAGQWLLISGQDTPRLLFAFKAEGNGETISKAFRHMAVQTARYWGKKPLLHTAYLSAATEAAFVGLVMGSYRIDRFKQKKETPSFPKVLYHNIESKDGVKILNKAMALAQSRMHAMELVDTHVGLKKPEWLGSRASELAKEYGYQCEVWNESKILKMGLHALHAVGRGSEHPPVFIICRYQGRSKNGGTDLALVGKGITFDTGGISIKDSANLHYMKSDMAGGAAVLGAIAFAAMQKLPLNITAIVPAAENAVDARSFLPGEVIDSYAGKRIEIIDTDAEGRLVLADALAYAVQQIKPKAIIDMATLTGSSLRALGTEAAALYCDNEPLQKLIYNAGISTGDKVWPMPLWSDYDGYIHSDVADVSNLPLKPLAGSIAAAKFLQVFALNHPAWAHIDMPGQAFGDSPFAKMKSATGYGVQLFAEVMIQLAENADIRQQLTLD